MQRLTHLLLVFSLGIILSLPAAAHPVDSYEFRSPAAERRALTLARKLRCPQCQNQNLLESNASIAQDLRLEVYQLIDSGRSDEEVISYMTTRFGEFVLYDPPFNAATLLLWGAPPLLLLFAFRLLWRKRRKNAISPPLPAPSVCEATLRTSVNRAVAETERHGLAYLYADAPGLEAELTREMVLTHGEETLHSPLPGVRSRYLAPCLIMGALLAALVWYGQSGRWQTASHWRQAPDLLLSLDGEELKDAAEQRLETRIRSNPRDIGAWAELAQLYLYRDRYEQALQVYDHIARLEEGMSASTLAAKATVLYYQAGQRLTPEAQRLLDEALLQDAGEVTALMLLASDHFLNARYSEAIKLWQRLLDEGRPRVNREAVIQAIQTARLLEN